MTYPNIHPATFISRPNRFIAYCLLNGERVVAHVKNTGRCKELLVEGCTVYLTKSDNPARKTLYDLVAVRKGDLLINMDSQAPNELALEWVRGGLLSDSATVKREVRFGDSRFDLYFEEGDRKGFIEVKGCTLEREGIAYFPDAPTERGVKHINELIRAKAAGYEAYILFVIQMKGVKEFRPNRETHPEFAEALIRAEQSGVKLLAYDCITDIGEEWIDNPVKIVLDN